MFDRIFGRLLQALPTLLLSSLLVFLIIRLVPGDPARTLVGYDAPIEEVDAVRVSLGLDQPLAVQYLRWLGRATTASFLGLYDRPESRLLAHGTLVWYRARRCNFALSDWSERPCRWLARCAGSNPY